MGASLVAQMVKDLPAMQETQVPSLDQGMIPRRRDCLPTPGFLPGETWMEELGGLQSMGSQRVEHD